MALVSVGYADGGNVGVWRVLQQAGARHHGEVQGQALPGNVAQTGNSQVDIAAQDVDPDGVADADPQPRASSASNETSGGPS